MKINNRDIGPGAPCYIIAEVSCNHEGSLDDARRIIEAAAGAGADAAKIQTYTADTLTRAFDRRLEGTMWSEIDLYRLYEKAHTPWKWHEALARTAEDCGIHLFSTPFDETAVDHLTAMGVPAIKIASFEIVDTKLLEKAAAAKLPILISNGMSTFHELQEAISLLRANGASDIALLHCNSGYPAAFEEANLKTIPALRKLFGTVVGLSDHTLFVDPEQHSRPMGHITPIEAVRFCASVIEVHLTLDRDRAKSLYQRNEGGFDWAFSRTPDELARLTAAIRRLEQTGSYEYESELEQDTALKTHGRICLEPTERELASRSARPSLWVVEDIKKNEPFRFAGGCPGNIDSIRPGGGLPIRFADFLQHCKAACDISRGTPLTWDLVDLDDKN